MPTKKIALGLGLAAVAVWGFFWWSLVGAYTAHLFTNG